MAARRVWTALATAAVATAVLAVGHAADDDSDGANDESLRTSTPKARGARPQRTL